MRRSSLRRLVVVAMTLALLGCGDGGDDAQISGSAVTGVTTTVATDCTPTPDGTSVSTNAPTSTSSTTSTSTSTSAPTSTSSTTTEVIDSTTSSTQALTTTTERATTSTTDPELAAAQTTLDSLGYWLGEIDGVMGSNTRHAITAFQKAEALDRTGELDAATLARLADASRPTARTSSGITLEVDLSRQILLTVSDGAVGWILDIATGSSATPTPPGEFSIYNEIDGYRHAPLGTLYRPKYFNGGIAFHGYTSVPSQPASHGCVRLTYPAMDMIWDGRLAPLGTTVLVY